MRKWTVSKHLVTH